SSDLAKGFDTPIIHVNADDAEGSIAAIRLAMAFRERFRKDVVVDLVGYRRFGHNEGDEPAYTQPLMYKRIEEHPTVRELYAEALVGSGVIAQADVDELDESVQQAMKDAHAMLREAIAAGTSREQEEKKPGRGSDAPIETAAPAELLQELNE